MQHFASRTSTSSTPGTVIPSRFEETAVFARDGFVVMAGSAATSSVFSRWMTLLTIWPGWSFPAPSAT